MTDLKNVLDKHSKWLRGIEGGSCADLRDAYLRDAYLRDADLRDADLGGADLRDADLGGADLRDAYLRDAYLRGAYLRDADLGGADLGGADLRDAYLRDADLGGADLGGADLGGADLRDAYLRGAYLGGADLPHTSVCPDEGAFIGWKKLKNGTVCKLQIPAEAKRVSPLTGRKCRAEFVDVLEGEGESERGGKYTPGERVYPDSFDDDRRIQCSNGIHFFVTKAEAEEWM